MKNNKVFQMYCLQQKWECNKDWYHNLKSRGRQVEIGVQIQCFQRLPLQWCCPYNDCPYSDAGAHSPGNNWDPVLAKVVCEIVIAMLNCIFDLWGGQLALAELVANLLAWNWGNSTAKQKSRARKKSLATNQFARKLTDCNSIHSDHNVQNTDRLVFQSIQMNMP